MQKKQRQKKENSERWLLTYADLITLLMILFILLFAISNVSQDKYEQLSESLHNSMGGGVNILGGSDTVLPGNGGGTPVDLGGAGDPNDNSGTEATVAPTVGPTEAPGVSGTPSQDDQNGNSIGDLSGSLKTEQDMTDFEHYIRQVLLDLNMGVSVNTTMEDRGLTISFKNDIFFDSGQDTLKDEMKKGLDQIAKLLVKVDNKIIIEGHTDNVPLSSKNKFDSNWQLSAARAANVAQYLTEEEGVDGNRISAVGFGEYHPIDSNDTAEGRSKNRRVDIIILYGDTAE